MESPVVLKFASYNIFQSRYDNEKGNEMANIAKVIVENDFDVVGLVEVDKYTNRFGDGHRFDAMKELVEEIYEQYGKTYYYAYFPAMNHYTGGEYGDAILSKYPILETEAYLLESGTSEQRVLGRAAIDVEGETVQFFVTHLSYESLQLRQTQFQQVNEIINTYDNFILTGDFNTGDFEEYRVLEGAAMVNDTAYSVPTFPKTMLSIDNIVYSTANWQFEKPINLTESYSDHYMLYATGVYTPKK